MPLIASFEGVEVYMYFNDHAPPHVHAFYGDDEVLVVVRNGSVYAGELSGAKLSLVREHLAANVDALLERWAQYRGG